MRWFTPAATLLLAWGALAFGAEYAWAYAPLLVFGAFVGAVGLAAPGPSRRALRPLGAALGAVFVAGALQIAPLPEPVLRAVSPARAAHDYDALYATAVPVAPDAVAAEPRTISIRPSRTLLGLAFLAGLSLFFLGSVRALATVSPAGLARWLIVLGVAVAAAAIAHEASGSLRVYGVWLPRKAWRPATPFVNPNHLAGWLLMALSLTAGYLAGAVARVRRSMPDGWRRRVGWLSSRDASEVVLTGSALVLMALAILVTGSVSGLACLAVAAGVLAVWAFRRWPATGGRMLVPAALAMVLLAALGWADLRGVAGEVARTWAGAFDVEGRIGLWQDTLRVIRDFPLAGTGLNTYGITMLAYQTHGLEARAVEAHNDYLQLAAEGGLLLALPILAVAALFLREVRRRFRERADDTRTWWLRAGAVTGLAAIALQELVDFSLQMPGNAALFCALAAIAIHRRRERRQLPGKCTTHGDEDGEERRPVAVRMRPPPDGGDGLERRSLTGTARRRRANESLLHARMAQPLPEAPSGPGAVRRCGPSGRVPVRDRRSKPADHQFGWGSASVKHFHARRGA